MRLNLVQALDVKLQRNADLLAAVWELKDKYRLNGMGHRPFFFNLPEKRIT